MSVPAPDRELVPIGQRTQNPHESSGSSQHDLPLGTLKTSVMVNQ